MNRFSKLAFSLCLVGTGAALWAQFETSEVLGTVRDPSAAGIPKTTVTLTNQDTGVQLKTSTNEDGEYNFFNVKVGRYTLDFEHTGFSKTTTQDVAVEVNARQRVDVTLQVGVVTEAVQVSAAASALETDSSEQSQVISSAGGYRAPAQRPQLRGPGVVIRKRNEVSDVGCVCAGRHAARRRVQRERHAEHV